VDISCYILGDKSLDIVSGAISFPQGTIIPPLGFLVVGGSNAPNVNINVNNLRSSSNFVGTSNWRFNNESGSCALYDNNLQIVDAVYWGTNSNVINDRVNSVGNPFEFTLPYPSGSGCNYTSGVIIPAPKDNPTQFEFIGDVASSNVGTQTIGKSTYRSTDGGGTWIVGGVGAANNTPGACNSTCATPSTGGGTTGTCNGTASVTATGSGSFKYEWKNGNTAIGKDSASVGNLCAGTYKVIVTDKTTNCVDSTTVTVADDIPQINPAFTQVPSICNGGSFTLPTTSTNNITGTWTPTIDNTKTTTYTFTPTTGQCANTATMTVTVNQPVTPAFTQVLPICAGGTITLPTSSNNSINGSWTPAIDNTKTTTYTFTPTDGQCATTATMTVTVNEKKQPLITCGNNTTNSVEFKWDAVDGANSYDLSYEILNSSSSPINSTGNTETTFTVSGLTTGAEVKITVTPVGTGSCFEPASSTCKAQACTTPNVSTTPNTVCKGTGGGSCVPEGKGLVLNEVMVFPAGGDGTPPNGLIYRGSKEYIEIFNGSCDTIDVSGYFIAMKQTLSVVSTGGTFRIPNVPASKIPPKKHIVLGSAEPGVDIPVSDIDIFIRLATSCLYSGNFVLANIDGWCALYNAEGAPLDAIYWSSNENNINTKPNDFGGVLCLPTGSIPSSLPNAQDIKRDFPDLIKYVGNNFTASAPPVSRKTDGGGEWVRTLSSSISKTASTGNCNGGTCSTPSTPVQPTCNGTATVNITTGNATDYDFEWIDSSGNVVGGNTQTIDKLCAGRYTVKVTDKLTGCVGDTTVTVTDNIIQVTPEFNTNVFDTICQGAILTTVTLPGVSNNGITGTWNPGSLSSDVAGDISYTFTPAAGQCADPVTFTQRVNARETPTFDFNLTSTICSGDPTTPNNLPGISNNNIIGSWSPTPISNNQSDEYTFTPLGNACANTVKLKVTVIQRPSVTVRNDTTIYHNAVYPGDIFSGLPTGSVVTWKNSNPGIGLPDSGKGNIPAFTAINIGSEPVTATITVKATNNNCDGTQRTFRITVKPLNRDVFIPNMFTPNGDGKNDVLMAYGNYITKIEMRIFNQWGQLIKVINNPNTGWDGTHNGKPQPVGVYVFTLRANLADGTEINKKGSITLLR
jgi:gliding motility-associated-like protein